MKTRKYNARACVVSIVALVGCSNPPEGPEYGAGGSTSTGGSSGTGGASTGGSTGTGGTAAGTGGASGTGGNGSTEGGTDGAAGGAAVIGHPDPNGTYPTHDGFSLYLVEEFEQPI